MNLKPEDVQFIMIENRESSSHLAFLMMLAANYVDIDLRNEEHVVFILVFPVQETQKVNSETFLITD